MSEKEKNCGTCRHYVCLEDGETNPCGHPLITQFAMKNIPAAMTIVYLYPTDGTDCPCHEPMEDK